MQNGLLPKEYFKTIITEIWDNIEVSPPLEIRLQGFRFQL
jgi:hypothetical protein